ncbi:MAG: DUF4340 domain-containing protein [Candidatus Poribacteria bacterium]|nr:DUF4340 domain-containing protein [Candidatus Poribacteria bacterium]
MSFRTTLIIIIILIGITATYFLFFNEPAENTSKDDKPRIAETYDLPREDIQKVRLSYADAAYQTMTIEKNSDNIWQLTTPFVTDANSARVNEMLDDFVNKRIRQTLEVSEYDKYGLETPTIKIELWKSKESSPKTFLIGKKGINYSVYTKEKSEAHIFLIESSALDDLSKSPTDLRDKSLIKFNPNSIIEIQFQKPEAFSCQKDGDIWKMTHPLSMNADTEEIEYILSELHALQVSTFEADGENVTPLLEKSGLEKPRIQLTFKDENKEYGLGIGAPVPSTSDEDSAETESVYVQSVHQGGIYTVTDDIIRLLNKSMFDLRDKRVLDFQRGDTTKFEIQRGMQKIVGIKLDKDTWQLQNTQKTLADSQAVSDLLFGVDSLKAVAFVTDSAENLALYGLEPPMMQVLFTIRGEDKPAVLLIGNNTKENSVYVKANNSEQITRVKRDLIDKIAKGEMWLRNKQIFKFSIDDPIRVTVKYNDGSQEYNGVQFTCQRLGTNWRLTSPVQENANNAEVNAILYELIDLKAVEFVGEPFGGGKNELSDATTGFNSPQIQITVELRVQKVFTLQVGKVDPLGRYYARLQNKPDQIFLLDAEIIPKLKTKVEWLRAKEEE